MMQKQVLSSVVAAGILLAACAPQTGDPYGHPTDQQVGAVLGGIAGGFLGSKFGDGGGQTVMAIAGALAGAWAGSAIATGLNSQDRGYYDRAAEQAQTAPVGEPIEWYNPESGAQGTITPTREGQTRSGEYCREFQQTITVDGQTQRAYGTACRQPDGSWQIVN